MKIHPNTTKNEATKEKTYEVAMTFEDLVEIIGILTIATFMLALLIKVL